MVALTRHLDTESVPISSIGEVDEPYWGDPTSCRNIAEHVRLINEADLMYPIILSSDGRVMDGMHRVLKALIQGETHVLAVRFIDDPAPDFVGVDPDDLPYEEESSKEEKREV